MDSLTVELPVSDRPKCEDPVVACEYRTVRVPRHLFLSKDCLHAVCICEVPRCHL